MIRFFEADLRDCPPSVVLCRVTYRLIARHYRYNPLHFGSPGAGITRLAGLLDRQGFPALAACCIHAETYCRLRKVKLALWRFDVCRIAGKVILRARDRRCSSDGAAYPRITNRGVGVHQPWVTSLPEDLPDVRTTEGRARQ
jgi:hypothetical protein